MSSPSAKPGLARVVRGLSAIFWSLPAILLLDAKTAMDSGWHSFGVVPSAVASGLLVYGVRQLRYFQSQERIWIAALERAEIFGWMLLALSPFPIWWNRVPSEPFFLRSLVLLLFSGLAFLLTLNHTLLRLALMIPDETLRLETRLFSQINRVLLLVQVILLGIYILLTQTAHELPPPLAGLLMVLDDGKQWWVLLFALVPVALTMTLTWKAKDVILTSVFQSLGEVRDPRG